MGEDDEISHAPEQARAALARSDTRAACFDVPERRAR